MVPSAAIAKETRTWIRTQLHHNIQNPKSFNNDYIRYQDIQKAWSGNDTLQRVFQANVTLAQVKLITEDLLRFLSVLVFIRADDFLDGFPSSLFDEAGHLLYKDSSLPYRDNQVPPFEDLALCRDFFNYQFLFTPEPLFESPTVQTIDDQRRLPFEVISKDVFGGAYGKVDKKGISPFYFNTLDNNQNHKVKFVACKTFHPSNLSNQAAKRELDNLQVLKTSRTTHGHIRTHVVIIFYRGEHHILLPWADHFDLDFFLREGYSYSGEPLYEFKLRFPKIQPATILQDTCRQMLYISEALKWLHTGFGGDLQNLVHFAHMDLKPNNILIDREERSSVGKWILTDFGISTFKEDDEAVSADLVSFENLTFRTAPARLPGAYQPPETEKTDQRSAGRRGDIWAFGCIFAEVLSFALGRRAAVEEFRVCRKQIQNKGDTPEGLNKFKNDFFYEEYRENVQVNGRLGTQTRQSYRLRSGVDQWLRNLPMRYTNTNRTIDCCVQTIRTILEVDGSQRIGAEPLVKKMQHVVHHVTHARKSNSLQNCPLEWSKLQSPFDPPLPDLSDASQSEEVNRLPSIKLTASGVGKEDMLSENGAIMSYNSTTDFSDQIPCATVTLQTQNQITSPSLLPAGLELRPNDIQGQKYPTSGRRDSARGLANTMSLSEANDTSHDNQSDRSRRSIGGMSRAGLHGVTTNQDKERDIGIPVEFVIPSLRKLTIHSISLCPSGQYMAYLVTQPKKACQTVFLHKVSLGDSSVQVPQEIILPAGPVWKHIVQAGYNFAVWGNQAGGIKHVTGILASESIVSLVVETTSSKTQPRSHL
ncbi:unnamed protein product [Alternaria alternata]